MQKGTFDRSHRINRKFVWNKGKILNFIVEIDYTDSLNLYTQHVSSADVDTQILKAIFTHNTTGV